MDEIQRHTQKRIDDGMLDSVGYELENNVVLDI